MTLGTKRIAIAAALVCGTALAGAASRGKTVALPPAVAANGQTTFAAPTNGPVTFTGHLDRTAVLQGRDGTVRMELVIGGKAAPGEKGMRRPTDLVIVLDRSGSMGGDKIEHARAATRELIGQLWASDRFGLVTYSDGAALTLPLSAVDDRSRTTWLGTVDGISADGGTNMSSGLDLGLDVLAGASTTGRVPRLILISDGLANQGDSSPDGLRARAIRAARGEAVLSTVGVGANFNEYLMHALADAGTGNYYYLQNALSLAEVFARELDAARTTVASALAVTIEPMAGVKVVDAGGYPIEETNGRVTFRPGALFAGQERRIWVTLAVPQAEVRELDLARFALAHGEGESRTTLAFAETPRIACVKDEETFYSKVDADTWGRSVVVDSYNKMKEEVAREVKSGRRDQALKKVQEFKDEAGKMNARLRSEKVTAQLADAESLGGEVAAAFEGDRQQARQNELSKAASADALDGRRVGSKKIK